MSTSQVASPLPGTLLPCFVFDSHQELARHVAQLIAGIVRDRRRRSDGRCSGCPPAARRWAFIASWCGCTSDEGLDFSSVVTFNLDEYLGLGPERLQSYHRWMHEHFFNHVNIPPENIHIPDGLRPASGLKTTAASTRRRSTGPAASTCNCWASAATATSASTSRFRPANSRTRLATLDPVTRQDAASDFFSEENVPTQAITMGLGTIFEARKIVLIALGEHKADIIRETAEGPLHAARAGQLPARTSGRRVLLVDRPRPAS